MKRILEQIGETTLWALETLGGINLLFWRTVASFFPPDFDKRETWRNLYKVGVKSYPIVVMTALFTGALMVIQSAHFVQATGATIVIPLGTGFTVLAEIGPVLIGLMFSGRVGANNTAELGTMAVTEQIDALRALAIDPIRYLVVPRFISMCVMLLLLTALGDFFAILGAMVTNSALIDFTPELFFNEMIILHFLDEYLMGLFKAATFGIAISTVSCYFGMTVRGGAVGVGRAVNNSVVATAIAIFVLDLLTNLLWVQAGWLTTG